METGHCFIAWDVAWMSSMKNGIQMHGLDASGVDLIGIKFEMGVGWSKNVRVHTQIYASQ